jgi:diphthamide biosynthesis protein 2
MTFNQAAVYRFDAETSQLEKQTLSSNKALMRRFYLIERPKDADIIGVRIVFSPLRRI